jgi:hypothetical protein
VNDICSPSSLTSFKRSILPASSLVLLVSTLVVGAVSGRPLGPISVELASGAIPAFLIFASFGLSLILFLTICRRLGWKALGGGTAVLLLVLLLIAFTDPSRKLHLWAFSALLALGIPWMIAYAEAQGRRIVSILTVLLVLAVLAIGFILSVSSVFVDPRNISPVGLFQRGFLIVFAILGMFPQEATLYESPAVATSEDP